jgi:hypothetical protein
MGFGETTLRHAMNEIVLQTISTRSFLLAVATLIIKRCHGNGRNCEVCTTPHDEGSNRGWVMSRIENGRYTTPPTAESLPIPWE